MPDDRAYELERDRFGLHYSGPLEVGECIRVVRASSRAEAERDEALAELEERPHIPGDHVVVHENRAARGKAAEAEVERLRGALTAARALIDSEVDNATEATLNADRAASVIDAALSPREDACGLTPRGENACPCGRFPDPGIKPGGGCWCTEEASER